MRFPPSNVWPTAETRSIYITIFINHYSFIHKLIFLYISKISLFVCNGFLPHVFGEIDGHIVLVFQLVCLIQKEMVINLFEFDACQFF